MKFILFLYYLYIYTNNINNIGIQEYNNIGIQEYKNIVIQEYNNTVLLYFYIFNNINILFLS
jgi:hypothetical protein